MIDSVLRLVWDYPTEGESTYGLQPVFVNLSEEQVRQGYQVHVVAKRLGSQPAEERHNGVSVHRVSPPFNANAFRALMKLTRGGGEWVVHSHATCGIFLYMLRKTGSIRYVSHSHGTSRSHHVPIRYRSGQVQVDYSQLGIAYDMVRERLLWSSADRVLAVSRTLAQDLNEFYGINPGRLRVVYNGVDVDLFQRLRGFETPPGLQGLEGKRIVLYVGHFGLRKGVFFLIRAMSKVLLEVPDAHLVCIGGVPDLLGAADYWSLLKSEAISNGVEGHVTLLDKVRNKDLVRYYSMASAFVLPSYYESISKVTLEAMACEVPVVASNSGGIPEVVDDGVTGLLVPY